MTAMAAVPEQFRKQENEPEQGAPEQEAPEQEAPAKQQASKQLDAAGVRALMASYGSGETTLEATVEQLRPLYEQAAALHSGRAGSEESDPDAASEPDPFIEISVARQTGVISAEQYLDLGNALIRADA